MKATFINAKNAVFYLTAVPESLIYEAGLLIGAQDEDGTACGVLAAAEQSLSGDKDKVLNLLYIYVHPDYRNRGAGTEMIHLLMEYAGNNGKLGIQVQYSPSREHMMLWEFLKNKGFETVTDEEDESEYRIPIRNLEEKMTNRSIKVPEETIFLEKVSKIQWNRFQQYMDDAYRAGKKSSFALLPRKAYSKEYSCLAFNKDEFSACALVTICGNGDVELKNFFVAQSDARILVKMLSNITERLISEKGDDIMVRIVPASSSDGLNSILTSDGVKKIELIYQFISL